MTILTIQPSDIDNYLRSENPDNNYGGAPFVYLRLADRNAILKFDFSALPAGAIINSATLSVYKDTDSASINFFAYRLTQTAWTELGSTWNKYDGTNNWATAGGDYTTVDFVEVSMAGLGWLNFDVTAQVQYAQNNTSEIAHFLLKGGTANLIICRSREYSDTVLRPKLVIDYSVPISYLMQLGQRYALNAYSLNQESLNQRYALVAPSGPYPTSLNQRYALVAPSGPYPTTLNQRYIYNGYPTRATIVSAVIYTLTLTGAPDGLSDIILPMSSFQSRLKDGDPSWLSAIVPNGRQYSDSVNTRPNGELIITRIGTKEDGSQESVEIARVNLERIRTDEGGRSSGITLSGHKTTSGGTPKGIDLVDASYKAVYQGKRHVRTRMDSNVVPGDQANMAGEVFTIGVITRYVNPRITRMEVVEA